MLTRSDLSQDQIVAFDAILAWLGGSGPFAGKKTLSLGGYAGSGKSTVVSVLAHELLKLGPLAFCAFTGKASSVLARKLQESGISTSPKTASRRPGGLGGISPKPYCGTIHGLVYAPCDVCMPPEPKHTCEEYPDSVLRRLRGREGSEGTQDEEGLLREVQERSLHPSRRSRSLLPADHRGRGVHGR